MASAAHAQDTPSPTPTDTNGPGVAALPSSIGAEVSLEEDRPSNASDGITQNPDQIVVRGLQERESSWRRAETERVIVYSNGSESRLRQAAIDLERLDYLLSLVFGRLDAQDETEKLEIVLIGNPDFMESMSLVNWRSAEGPFGGPVQQQRYYDPRIDGAVMAVSRADLTFSANAGVSANQIDPFFTGPGDFTAADSGLEDDEFGDTGFSDDPGPPDFIDDSGGEQVRPWEQAMFAGYTQHYITTHLPAAYPRWYLDSVGALFSTVRLNDDGEIEYGLSPPAFRGLYSNSQPIDVGDLLTSGEPGEGAVWSAHHAWLMAHFFFLSSDNQARKQQLAQYMGAIANGRTMEEAATLFGDLEVLQKEIERYGDRRTRFARVPFDGGEADVDIQRLGVSDAMLISKRLQIDPHLILPDMPGPETPNDARDDEERAYQRASAMRDAWLDDLRGDVAEAAINADAMVLLAQAECRSGNFDACIAAADHVLAEFPSDVRASSWKAIALVHQAASGPESMRGERITAARALAVAANRVDPDALLPLVAYFRSFTVAGEAAPEAALLGMLKVMQAVPNAPEPRLLLTRELVRQSLADAAADVTLPLLGGPWDSPERRMARQLCEAVEGARLAGC